MSDLFGTNNDYNTNTLTGLIDIYADNIYTNTETVNTELQVNRGDFQSLYVNGTPVLGTLGSIGYWGQMWSTTTQLVSAANTITIMTVNNIDASSNGVNYSSGSHINIENSGVYNIQFSAQFVATQNPGGDVYIWLRINGTDVVGSTGKITVDKNGILPSWNFIIPFTAGDYFEFVWSSTDIHTELQYIAASSSPTKPATSSLVITVQQVVSKGLDGTAATITAGSATSLTAGSVPYVTNSGTSTNAVFNFGIPAGKDSVVSIGSTNTLIAGSDATVTNTGTPQDVVLNFGIPRGPQGVQGEQGPQGEQGEAGAATVEAYIAAAAAAASAAAASGSASAAIVAAESSAASAEAAAASAASINTEFEGRVEAVETKTQAQYAYIDIDSTKHTQFEQYLEITNSSLAPTILINGINKTITAGDIVIDGDLQKITNGTTQEMNGVQIITPQVWTNEIDARTSYEDINIGKTSSQNVNIGNPLTQGVPSLETTINFYGKVNFGFNTIVGTGLSQF